MAVDGLGFRSLKPLSMSYALRNTRKSSCREQILSVALPCLPPPMLTRRHIRPPSPKTFIEYWQGNKQGNLLPGVLFVTV